MAHNREDKAETKLSIGDSVTFDGVTLKIKSITAPQLKTWEEIMDFYELKTHDARSRSLRESMQQSRTESLREIQIQDAHKAAINYQQKFSRAKTPEKKNYFLGEAEKYIQFADQLEQKLISDQADKKVNYYISTDNQAEAELNASGHYIHYLLGKKYKKSLEKFLLHLQQNEKERLLARQVVIVGKLPLGLTTYQSAQTEQLESYLQSRITALMTPFIQEIGRLLSKAGTSSRSKHTRQTLASKNGKRQRSKTS